MLINFRSTTESLAVLKQLKEEIGLSYAESIRRGLFLLQKEYTQNESAIALGKAYQDALIKRKNETKTRTS